MTSGADTHTDAAIRLGRLQLAFCQMESSRTGCDQTKGAASTGSSVIVILMNKGTPCKNHTSPENNPKTNCHGIHSILCGKIM